MEQRSEEWLETRRFMLTASRFGDVLAGRDTARHKNLIRELVHAFVGVPDFDSDQEDKLNRNPWFRHGTEWEDEAIGEYEFIREVTVERAGFIVHPKYDFIGCSPDGLVGQDGGTEVKSRKSKDAFIKSKRLGLESVYRPQIQGCMWITGRKWWDYVSYYKNTLTWETDMHIHRVNRDDIYIQLLEEACLETWDEVQTALEKKQ